jgi:hypothetical protein
MEQQQQQFFIFFCMDIMYRFPYSAINKTTTAVVVWHGYTCMLCIIFLYFPDRPIDGTTAAA